MVTCGRSYDEFERKFITVLKKHAPKNEKNGFVETKSLILTEF